MITLRVNGQEQSFDGDPTLPLLWYLRDEVGLTGTKFGCGEALCGACTVHLSGQAVRSCIVTMADASGKDVVTIEGLDPKGDHPVQRAWRAVNVPQCGFCQAGQIMQASALLTQNSEPVGRANPHRDGGEYLSLRVLPAHRGGDPPRSHGSVT